VILGRVNSVFKQLGPDREKALAVFISVDPQRDTQQVLREYVKYFSAHTVALTGKKEEIDDVVKQYGAKYEIEKSDSALGYHVSHTTDIYLIDQRGALRSRFKHTDRAALMVDGVKGLFRNPHRRAAVKDAKRGNELLAKIIAAMGGGQQIDGLTSYADVHKATAKLPQGDQEVEGRWIIDPKLYEKP
jgi:hypothetical protein